jgi:phosphomannomutase
MPKGQAAKIEEVDLKTNYIKAICQFADLDLIAKAGFKFAVDSMYGSGRGVLAQIFSSRNIPHIAIRQNVDPLFPGINPEPILPHIALLQETVVKENCAAGFATDGDADRLGAVDENGNFVDSHKIFSGCFAGWSNVNNGPGKLSARSTPRACWTALQPRMAAS